MKTPPSNGPITDATPSSPAPSAEDLPSLSHKLTNRPDEPLIDRPLRQRNDVHHNHDRPGEDARIAQAGERPPDDEGHRAGRRPAQRGPQLEEPDGDEEDPFGRVERVDATEEQLRGALGEQVRAAVPPRVAEGLEVVGDAGDGGGDDGAVLCFQSAFHFPRV